LTRHFVVLLLLAAFAHSTRSRQSPAITPLTAVESNYADLMDAHYVLQTIDSGLFTTYQGKDRAAWSDVYQSKRNEEAASLATMSAENFPPPTLAPFPSCARVSPSCLNPHRPPVRFSLPATAATPNRKISTLQN
jgi:hypothetical protein